MGKWNWKLRFTGEQVDQLVEQYEKDLVKRGQREHETRIVEIGSRARRDGQFSRSDFLKICHWKSPRSRPLCESNTAKAVSEITRIALSTSIDRVRVEVLQCLEGVSWPTASTLLHLAHHERYPILDVRALWSWSIEKAPGYTFSFWWEYVQQCRGLADELNVDMRKLDRALWQYSKMHQGPL